MIGKQNVTINEKKLKRIQDKTTRNRKEKQQQLTIIKGKCLLRIIIYI